MIWSDRASPPAGWPPAALGWTSLLLEGRKLSTSSKLPPSKSGYSFFLILRVFSPPLAIHVVGRLGTRKELVARPDLAERSSDAFLIPSGKWTPATLRQIATR